MSADYRKAIEALYADLNKVEEQALEFKSTINMLSKLVGDDIPFADINPNLSSKLSVALKSDQFFGKPLATTLKEYFNLYKKAATAEDILEALKNGGFDFPDNWKKDLYLKNLAISLSKNTADFIYIKHTNSWGLLEWYPEKKKEREKRVGQKSADRDVPDLNGKILEGNPEETEKVNGEAEKVD